ncbi:MAG: DUF4166 domain-containing protein [Hyphomicrobiaceae bacterium]
MNRNPRAPAASHAGPEAGSQPAAPLFQSALGDRWRELPPCVQRLHSGRNVETFSGRAHIARGRGLVAWLAAWLVGLPKAGADVPLTVTMTCTPDGEVWERSFAGRRLRSVLTPSPKPYHFRERFGLATYELELPVEDAVLHFVVRRGWLLGIPLPSLLLPRSCTREFAADGAFHFDVSLYAPVTGGLIVRYRGCLKPDAA